LTRSGTPGFALTTAFLIGALVAADSPRAAGQEPPAPGRDAYWLGAGLGVGSEDFAGSANLSYQHGAHLVSLRVAGTAGLFDDGFGDVALLYGRATRPPESRYRAGAGLGVALVDGCASPGDGGLFAGCDDRGTVLGLPIEAQLSWLPAEFLGLGLYGFADFNRARSFAGLTLTVQLGRVR
jgi:hypothetical protein